MTMHTQRDSVPAPPDVDGLRQPPQGAPLPGPTVPPAPVVQAAAPARRSSRKLLVVSALIVLMGGLLGLVAGRALTAKSLVVGMAHPVDAGRMITENDLVGVAVQSSPGLTAIAWADRGQVIGKTATTALAVGQIVVRGNLSDLVQIPSGQVMIGVQLKPGAYPQVRLSYGQAVQFVSTAAQVGAPLTPGIKATGIGPISALLINASTPKPDTQELFVTVQLPVDQGQLLAGLADHVAMILVAAPALAEGR